MISCFAFGQDNLENKNKETSEKISKKDFQKLGYGSIEYAQAIHTGVNFVGLGMEGKSGFNIKAQFFIYKHFFLAGTVGSNYFSVRDKTIVGNYNKTTVSHQYLNVGYELLPLPNTRLGLSISLFGESNFENKSMTNTREAFQNDDAHVRSYEFYFDYMINDEFAVYLNYAYRNDKMDIQTPPEIQNLFENANFHTVSIGVKLYFGNKDVVSGI